MEFIERQDIGSGAIDEAPANLLKEMEGN